MKESADRYDSTVADLSFSEFRQKSTNFCTVSSERGQENLTLSFSQKDQIC